MSKEPLDQAHVASEAIQERPESLTDTGKNKWERLWPVIACGAGLFSDGYLNNVIGSVMPILSKIYGKAALKKSNAQKNISAITFAGTVLGMLFFGYTSDKFSRKWSLMASTAIIVVFAILCTGAYGNGSSHSLFTAIAAYRFFLGVGIGGEYPSGSVGAAEGTAELQSGTRNWWFIMFTNVQIDLGFVIGAFVPMLVVLATTESHLRAAWRICLGIGIIPPLCLLLLRFKLQEPEAYKRNTMAKTRTPWLLVVRYYWWRLLLISVIWFIYDWISYGFGIYFSTVLTGLQGADARMWVNFGWNTLLNLFYMPGCILGAYLADLKFAQPKNLLGGFFIAQGILGFIMAGCYTKLAEHQNIGAFVVVYGIFLAMGEAGPGDNIGLVASKTCATPIRGQYYGIAAAIGKMGAFLGTYLFTTVQNAAGPDDGNHDVKRGQYSFWVASSLAIFGGCLALFLLPRIGQDTIEEEDMKFRQYLESHGYDTSSMGLHPGHDVAEVAENPGDKVL